VQFVAVVAKCENLECAVGRIAQPIFDDAESGVQIALFVTIAPHTGGRDDFNQ